MINSIKRTAINWFDEHKKLAYILGFAIAFPLLMATIFGVFGLLLWVFSLIFGSQLGAIVLICMVLGGICGYFIWNLNND